MVVVTDFVGSLGEAEVRRAVGAVKPRAELCIKIGGGHFESKLKKYKRESIVILLLLMLSAHLDYAMSFRISIL